MDRAAVFTDVVANGLRLQAHRMVADYDSDAASDEEKTTRAKAARLMHTAANLMSTAKVFHRGAVLWRHGKLE